MGVCVSGSRKKISALNKLHSFHNAFKGSGCRFRKGADQYDISCYFQGRPYIIPNLKWHIKLNVKYCISMQI